MSSFIVTFKDESERIIALSAIMATGRPWVRWSVGYIINGKRYPRLCTFGNRENASTYARRVVRYARRNLDTQLHYEILPIAPAARPARPGSRAGTGGVAPT